MGWVIDLDGSTLAEDHLTAGEWELLVALATRLTPHSELDVRPSHCPACRNAAGIVALVADGIPLLDACKQVADLPRLEILDAITHSDDVELIDG
jgi:hypothetical protein